MSLFKKPKRNFRLREIGDDDSEEEKTSASANVVRNVKKEKAPPKGSSSQQLLSFDEDWNDGDDGEVFQVKKSSQSKKMRKLLDKERKKKKEPIKNDKSVDNSTEKNNTISEESVIITVKNTLPVLNGREAEAAEIGGISSEEEEDVESAPGQHKFSKASGDVKTILQRGKIPDAATIHAARKQRQHVREMGDFIPLTEDISRVEKENNSRLLREDDASDGENERIKMSVDTASEDRLRIHAEFNAAQQSGSGEGSDKGEEDDWEVQQIRKGVTGAQIAAVQQETMFYQQLGAMMMTTPVPPPPPIISEPALNSPASAIFPPTPNVEPPSVLSLIGNIKKRLEEVKEVEGRHRREAQTRRAEVGVLGEESAVASGQAPALEAKFRFYQELRGYVTDLVDCLDEKIVLIEMLEERAMSLACRRTQEIISRRRTDIQDQTLENPLQSNRIVPRDENLMRRIAEREGRRIRRQRARELKGIMTHTEGMSSDDETTEAELITLRSTKEVLGKDAGLVLEDVVEEFANIDKILMKFTSWRETDMASYSEAYVSLCLPKLLSPLIRLNILFWDPLSPGSYEIEKSAWCKSVLLYGVKKCETEDDLKADPDSNLLPRIIDKVVLPKLTKTVSSGWDPMSRSQSLILVSLVTKLVQEYPTLTHCSKSIKTLLQTIVDKVKDALDNDVYIPLYQKQRLSEGGKVLNFFNRQVAVGIKLLSNVCRWQGLLSDEILSRLALDALLNRYLMLAIRTLPPIPAANVVHMIGGVLPRVWLNSGLPKLSQFVNQAKVIALQLNADKPLERDALERMNSVLKTSVQV